MDDLPADRFLGTLLLLNDRHILLTGAETRPLPGKTIFYGDALLRYGIPILTKPNDAIMPSMLLDDFREEHHGVDAIDFAIKRGDAFPRADVIGRRVSDGTYREMFLKELDLARPVRVYLFPGPHAITPLAQLDVLVYLDPTVTQIIQGVDGGLVQLPEYLPTLTINPARVRALPEILGNLF